jgi:hypothetical protein
MTNTITNTGLQIDLNAPRHEPTRLPRDVNLGEVYPGLLCDESRVSDRMSCTRTRSSFSASSVVANWRSVSHGLVGNGYATHASLIQAMLSQEHLPEAFAN